MEETRLNDPTIVPVNLEVAREGSYIQRMLKGKPIWPVRQLEGWEPFRVRPLGYDQEAQCHAEAARHVTEVLHLDPVKHENLASNEATVRILYQALLTEDSDPDDPTKAKPLAESLKAWRASPILTDLNLALLWTEYQDVKLSMSSNFDALPDEVRTSVIDVLKKNQSTTLLERWPRAWLMDLIASLAAQLASSTGSSSSTTPSSSQEDTV